MASGRRDEAKVSIIDVESQPAACSNMPPLSATASIFEYLWNFITDSQIGPTRQDQRLQRFLTT